MSVKKDDIITAVNNLDAFLKIPGLQGATVRPGKNGKPFFFSGGFTLVFELTHGTKKWAFRVWHVPVALFKERSREIFAYLSSKKLLYFADFIFDEQALVVGGEPQDTIRMEWLDGQRLKEYIGAHLNDGKALRRLADAFVKMCSDLHAQRISHGDLQHGNILVDTSGNIKLIDYDSICIPALEGQQEIVTGLKGYQHPSRLNGSTTSLKADYFSELIIFLSLLALVEKKSFWDYYQVAKSEHLLFSEGDLKDLTRSKIYSALNGLTPEIDGLLYILVKYTEANSFLDLEPFTSYQIAPAIEQFKADNTTIVNGMTVTLNWDTIDAQYVEIDNGIGQVAASGKLEVIPTAGTLYKLTAKGHFGVASCTVKVRVFPTPVITSIPVSIPSFYSKIEFDKFQFTPPKIDVSVNISAITGSTFTFTEPISITERLKRSLLSRQSVFSVSYLYDCIKRKIINQS
jgi:serine/threonine protein kinase